MLDFASVILVLVFGLLIVGNFACQIYVSKKVFGEQGTSEVARGVLRGNRTFAYGWKWADQLGIKDVMIFWSILLTFLLMIICGVGGMFIIAGPPT